MSKSKIVMACRNCKRLCEVDEERTTNSFRAYKPCKWCGGRAFPTLADEVVEDDMTDKEDEINA